MRSRMYVGHLANSGFREKYDLVPYPAVTWDMDTREYATFATTAPAPMP